MSDYLSKLIVGDQIGKGHFGTVYEGFDPVIGKVAVKEFCKGKDERQEQWEKRKAGLLAEGQRLRAAESDHIVRVYQILETTNDDKVVLILEFCENGCIDKVYKGNPISIEQLRKVLTDTALGLQTIHYRGMLHRDIKPSNILIDQNNRAKIGDFGLVTDNIIFGYANFDGYLDHLAIEVFKTRQTSIRSDIWAYGMTVYRLLHGHAYYCQLPRPSYQVPHGNFANNVPWLPHIPVEWRRFVRSLMHDDPDRRIQTADEILNKLSQLPIEPAWECSYSPNQVVWSLYRNNRLVQVQWNKHSPFGQSWQAYSYPLGNGRKRRLGGTTEDVSYEDVLRDLEQFFSHQYR